MDNSFVKIDFKANREPDKVPKVSGCAYSGNPISQSWSKNMIVIDLAGMEFAPQIPLMISHCNSTSMKLGEVTPKIVDNKLMINGTITSKTEDALQIVEDGKKSEWQLSIGADIELRHVLDRGETAKINGVEFTGPLIIADKTILREVSVVAIGADAETNMTIEAKFNSLSHQPKGEKEMNVEENNVVTASSATNVQETQELIDKAIQAERARVASIHAICNGEFPDIEHEAITANMSEDQVRAKVLDAIRAARPNTGPNVIVKTAPEVDQKVLECALSLRSGVDTKTLSAHYDEKSIEAGMKEMDLSLKDIVRESIRISGGAVPRSVDNQAIEAAFSTVSLPGILGNVANKVLLKSFESTPVKAFEFCSVGNLTDFKESERYRLTSAGQLQKVGADGEIKDGGFKEDNAKNKIDTYAEKFCLTRQMIINDDLGAFTKIPAKMGANAANLIDQLFFDRLQDNPVQADGNALFNANHHNLLSGSDSVLSKEALENAIKMFMNQTDSAGKHINVEPRKLLVPTALKFKAMELLHGALLIATGSTASVRPAYNALSDENINVIASPYLTSDTAWYLFGDPNQVDTFEIGFLKGKRTPTVERGETDFNTLGMWFRVYFDLGVREQDFRGIVKSNGAA